MMQHAEETRRNPDGPTRSRKLPTAFGHPINVERRQNFDDVPLMWSIIEELKGPGIWDLAAGYKTAYTSKVRSLRKELGIRLTGSLEQSLDS